MAQVLRTKFEHCKCNYDRLLIVREAQTVLRTARYAPDKAFRRGTPEWKKAIALDKRISIEVAATYDVSSSYVRLIKSKYQAGTLEPPSRHHNRRRAQ